MVKKQLEVVNELGLHARVASRIVRELRKFESSVIAVKNNKNFDLKNVTGVITVNAKHGDVLEVEFSGPDENEAAQAVEKLFADKFGER